MYLNVLNNIPEPYQFDWSKILVIAKRWMTTFTVFHQVKNNNNKRHIDEHILIKITYLS